MNDEVRARSQAAIEKKRKRKVHVISITIDYFRRSLSQIGSGQISQIKIKDALSQLK